MIVKHNLTKLSNLQSYFLNQLEIRKIKPDDDQIATINKIASLIDNFHKNSATNFSLSKNKIYGSKTISKLRNFHFFRHNTGSNKISTKKLDLENEKNGIYIVGNVGVGKTTMLEMIYGYICDKYGFSLCLIANFIEWNILNNCLLTDKFNYLSIQEMLDSIKNKLNDMKIGDLYKPKNCSIENIVLKYVNQGIKYIILDELNILNITDAMLFKQIFDILIEKNIKLFLCSNLPPNELYKGGLNENCLDSVKDQIKNTFEIIYFPNKNDCRRIFSNDKFQRVRSVGYICPSINKEKIKKILMKRYKNLQTDFFWETLFNNKIFIDAYSTEAGILMLDYDKIFKKWTSSFDFTALTNSSIKYIILVNMPQLEVNSNLDEIKRLIDFFDIAYHKKISVQIHSNYPVLKLFRNYNADLDELLELFFIFIHSDESLQGFSEKVQIRSKNLQKILIRNDHHEKNKIDIIKLQKAFDFILMYGTNTINLDTELLNFPQEVILYLRKTRQQVDQKNYIDALRNAKLDLSFNQDCLPSKIEFGMNRTISRLLEMSKLDLSSEIHLIEQ